MNKSPSPKLGRVNLSRGTLSSADQRKIRVSVALTIPEYDRFALEAIPRNFSLQDFLIFLILEGFGATCHRSDAGMFTYWRKKAKEDKVLKITRPELFKNQAAPVAKTNAEAGHE